MIIESKVFHFSVTRITNKRRRFVAGRRSNPGHAGRCEFTVYVAAVIAVNRTDTSCCYCSASSRFLANVNLRPVIILDYATDAFLTWTSGREAPTWMDVRLTQTVGRSRRAAARHDGTAPLMAVPLAMLEPKVDRW